MKKTVNVNEPVAAPILRGKMPGFLSYVASMNPDSLIKTVEGGKELEYDGMNLPAGSLKIKEETKEGYSHVAEENGYIEVFLNTAMDTDLEKEGLSREIIRRLQVMRKEMNLNYDDRIDITMIGDEMILQAVKKHEKKIMSETQANSIKIHGEGIMREWQFDGHEMKASIKKANS